MGLFAESSLMQARARAGVALPVALFGVVTVSLLAGGMLVLSTRNMPLAQTREEQARAMALAEAAVSHGFALLKGPLQSVTFNELLPDSLLVGHGLASGSEIPATGVAFGGGRYYAKVIDDPSAAENVDPAPDPDVNDVNNRVVLRCRGVTRTGATAEINAIVGPPVNMAFIANGNVGASGSAADVTGPCGSIHANGNLGSPSGAGFTIEGEYSATGFAGGSPVDPNGTSVQAQSNADTVDIPSMTYNQFCPASANYILRSDGFVLDVATGQLRNALLTAVDGWRATLSGLQLTWSQNGALQEGTYCAQGNVTIGGSLGPVSASIIAQGSIDVSGTPIITAPTHPDGLLFFAGGDVLLRGTMNAVYTGAIYARNQCDVAGNGTVNGSFMCLGEATVSPGPVRNLATTSNIAGSVTINYDCFGMFSRIRKILGWYQTIN